MFPGWQQELVLWGSGAGRGARATDSHWDRGQPQGAARRRLRNLCSKWDLARVDPGFGMCGPRILAWTNSVAIPVFLLSFLFYSLPASWESTGGS